VRLLVQWVGGAPRRVELRGGLAAVPRRAVMAACRGSLSPLPALGSLPAASEVVRPPFGGVRRSGSASRFEGCDAVAISVLYLRRQRGGSRRLNRESAAGVKEWGEVRSNAHARRNLPASTRGGRADGSQGSGGQFAVRADHVAGAGGEGVLARKVFAAPATVPRKSLPDLADRGSVGGISLN
jgi:hypothetical protein